VPRAALHVLYSIRSHHAFYLFDIAEEIDLAGVPACLHAATAPARLGPAGDARLPAVRSPGAARARRRGVQAGEIDGFRVRIKLFEYGVISNRAVAFVCRFVERPARRRPAARRHRGARRQATALCRASSSAWHPRSIRRARTLSEDYVVFAAHTLDERARRRAARRARENIAHLLRGERAGLSRQEREEVLRHRISYLADDLVVPTWNAGFVYDTEAGVQAAWRSSNSPTRSCSSSATTDGLLDNELERIYDQRRGAPLVRRVRPPLHARCQRAPRALHRRQRADRQDENALKSWVTCTRALYSLVTARLGLDRWKQNVADKLKTLDDIYRYRSEQTQMTRGHFLELAIIAILLFELALFFMGI